jgi:hypothetical protein
MSDSDKLAHIRELARIRAKRHYDANKKDIADKRKAQRAECRQALGKKPRALAPEPPAPESPAPAEPKKRLRVKRPVLAPAPAEPKKRLRVKRPVLAQPLPKTLSYEEAVKIVEDTPEIKEDGSRKTYIGHLATLHRILQCADLITCFQDPSKVIQALDDAKTTRKPFGPYSLNSKKAYTQAVLRLSDLLSITLYKETEEAYNDAFQALKLDSREQTKARQETAKESKEEALTYETYLPKVKEHFGEDSKEYLVASLYSLHGFRDDLQLEITDKPDNNKNHLIVPKRGESYRIHLTHYKTAGKYGEKTIVLPSPIGQLVRAYIRRNGLKKGDYLLGDKPLSGFVSKFNKAMGLPVGINTLRELHVAPVIDGMSSVDRVQLAKKMSHSPATSEHYRTKKKA